MKNESPHYPRFKDKIYGYHPNYRASFQALAKDFFRNGSKALTSRTISIKRFFDPRHPEVYVLPGQEFLIFTEDDEFGEELFALYKFPLPFSSTIFYADLDENGLVRDMMCDPAMWRLGGISQLAFLVPPEKSEFSERVFYLSPFFKHTRWNHSYLSALFAYVILARNGLERSAIIPFVLAAATHDIAIPTGGDSVVRIDPANLHEEHNYAEVMRMSGLAASWRKKYAFDLVKAEAWVKGNGDFGRFLDVVDKMSYTSLDMLAIGREGVRGLAYFLKPRPLLMDVWRDIRFGPGCRFYFRHPGRLYDFLYLRALEHKLLLFHPRARTLDFLYTEYVGRLYRRGEITKNDLLTQADHWLHAKLEKYFPDRFDVFVSPDVMDCHKFPTEEKRSVFCAKHGKGKIDHLDNIKKFNLCLDWPVMASGNTRPLRDAVSREKIERIEKIAEDCAGFYVYLKKPFKPLS